jgi:alkylation response protein AidB-like acyl-CoA dehydrogenase/electron transfer flavoprotein alpha subunit/electron transfer flavoprotein alpha/beta subunit/ferredoxin-like protein FixX
LYRQVNMLDVLVVGSLALAAAVSAGVIACWDRLVRFLRPQQPGKPLRSLYRRYARAAKMAGDLTPLTTQAAQQWEARLGKLAYQTIKESHLHVLWPKSIVDKNDVANAGLWHVCPAHVYEARSDAQGQVQVIANFENCIKCESCWRASDLVDWGRDGHHRFIYPVPSPVIPRLLESIQTASQSRPKAPRSPAGWDCLVHSLADGLQADLPGSRVSSNGQSLTEVLGLLDKLEQKLVEFDEALGEEPRTIDPGRGEYLEMLARYAQQLSTRVVDLLRDRAAEESDTPGLASLYHQATDLATSLDAKAQERSRRTWSQRYAWAAADGRQLRWHHLAGLRWMLDILGPPGLASGSDPLHPWTKTEDHAAALATTLAEWVSRLDAQFPAGVWRDLEAQKPLTAEQDGLLRDLLARVPAVDPAELANTLHPPLRKVLLAELGRRDPSLAYRVASHLWACDLVRLAATSGPWNRWLDDAARGQAWSCFAIIEATRTPQDTWRGEALLVPAAGCRFLVLLIQDQLVIVPTQEASGYAGLEVEPIATLGLRGAGLARIRLEGFALPETRIGVDQDRIRRVWGILSAADLVAIAEGMADLLCRRTRDHAISRVQFPGLFHDEAARDSIGKFGAVKKMVVAMEARRFLIETLNHTLSPVDFSSASLEQASLVKALSAEALGTSPGSIAYNAGQVFGGTGFSEDDILAKWYRDAAAWRFLGSANVDIYRRHGKDLLRNWRTEGRHLAPLRDEGHLFDQLSQRKALLAELDEVRNARSRIRNIVGDWLAVRHKGTALPSAFPDEPGAGSEGAPGPGAGDSQESFDSAILAEFAESVARQDAFLMASKALVLRTHARLECGLPAETPIALLRVWLEESAATLDTFQSDVRLWLESAGRRDERPVVELDAGPPVTRYTDFLAAACPYDSGAFLGTPVDLVQPRYVPEMIDTDPQLRAYHHEFKDLLSAWFGLPRDGSLFERYIEKQHRPDAADLDFCRQHGFFRLLIPKELGGEGRPKVDYYLLTSNLHRLADIAMALTVQVSTGIGSTPVILARTKDIPRAQKDLEAFLGDTALQQEVAQRLDALGRDAGQQTPSGLESAYRALQQRLDETVLPRPVVKSLCHGFLEAWQEAGRLGKEFQAEGMRAELAAARQAWSRVGEQGRQLQDELARRREAYDLFFRWISSGHISAFALTEPGAGSDTARVASRAELRSVTVEPGSDGTYRFVPAGAKEARYLLDARRLDFRNGVAAYRWSDSEEPAAICFDEYDYESDSPACLRYFVRDGRRVHFNDIAQLRERDGKLCYDYWEITGSKMWITNGRMAGIMCLYARTGEGVTGFIVDRHAEGLLVGKDEAKLGQCGSPTNEIALQAVRVPRENVIGIEGRGQVNALEALNAGRGSIGLLAAAPMEGLIHACRAFAAASGNIPDWAQWRLGRMEENRFITESLTYETLGRSEHPQTKSLRLESAITKLMATELLHQLIELAEEILGQAGQTQQHLVEKRKRDARVFTIYEGTSEIQRSLILKDLAADIAPRWSKPVSAALQHLGREALELEAAKAEARQRITAARELLGSSLWQNPNLQVNCFLLSEVAAWLKAADSVLGRMAWLSRRSQSEDGAEPGPRSELGSSAFTRCVAEARCRMGRFDEELSHLRRGFYAPEVRAATLLFEQKAASAAAPLVSHLHRPLRILVVLDPLGGPSPHPWVCNGALGEPFRTWSEADRAALENALRCRDAGPEQVTIQVAAIGSRAMIPALHEALRLGVERVRLVLAKEPGVTPDCAAAALAALFQAELPFDLIVGPTGKAGNEEGLTARMLAADWNVRCAGSAEQLAIEVDRTGGKIVLADGGGNPRVRPLPAAATIQGGLGLRAFTMSGYLAAAGKAVEVVRWPKRVEVRGVTLAENTTSERAAGTDQRTSALSPQEAAQRLRQEIGFTGTSVAVDAYQGAIESVSYPSGLEDRPPAGTVVAVLGTDPSGRLHGTAPTLLRAASLVANCVDAALVILLVTSRHEESWRRALGQLNPLVHAEVVLLAADLEETAAELRSRLLMDTWPSLTHPPRALIGEPWVEDAWISLAAPKGQPLALRIHGLEEEDGQLSAQTRRAGGNLVIHQGLEVKPGRTVWLTVAEDAVMPPESSARHTGLVRVECWEPRLERFYEQGDIRALLAELKEETGLVRLADADFIVDVGFGVNNQDGYEAVIQPLVKALQDMGVRNLMVGGSRKVTEELHLLPVDRQIGQSGVPVNPRVLLAIGISGAPQHLNYIGTRATILAFNKDPEAPLMTLNRRQSLPRVFPIVGDLFETVPALIQALRDERRVPAEAVAL